MAIFSGSKAPRAECAESAGAPESSAAPSNTARRSPRNSRSDWREVARSRSKPLAVSSASIFFTTGGASREGIAAWTSTRRKKQGAIEIEQGTPSVRLPLLGFPSDLVKGEDDWFRLHEECSRSSNLAQR